MRTCRQAQLPDHEVAPNQGAFLSLLIRMSGARRVLEIGTLGGYSTIWLARAAEHVTTLEVDPAMVAQRNLEGASVSDRVEIIVGPALNSLDDLIARKAAPYELVFIDADKPNNPSYLDASLRLTCTGSVIIADNIVRNGAITDAHSTAERFHGVRTFMEQLAADPRLETTAMQTVGLKGWDGFALALVR